MLFSGFISSSRSYSFFDPLIGNSSFFASSDYSSCLFPSSSIGCSSFFFASSDYSSCLFSSSFIGYSLILSRYMSYSGSDSFSIVSMGVDCWMGYSSFLSASFRFSESDPDYPLSFPWGVSDPFNFSSFPEVSFCIIFSSLLIILIPYIFCSPSSFSFPSEHSFFVYWLSYELALIPSFSLLTSLVTISLSESTEATRDSFCPF